MTTYPNPAPPPKSGSRRTNTLPSGCMLDEYRIDAILGAGGFGVTYKALDTHLENWAAIKEYFPVEWSFRDADGVTVHPNTQGQASNTEGQASDYIWGLERFLDEARVLARVQHPFVVRIKRYFRAHGTAYIVMDYEEGEPLSAILQDGETLGEEEVRGLLEDVLPALQAVHDQGFLHRDLKPSNLYVRSSDHRVILIDFGAAREAMGRHSKMMTSLVTPGYSPPEQYTTRNDRYGTWTDIYALGAVLYRCITGHTPAEAADRLLDDSLEPAVEVGAGRYSTNLLRSIDQALAVRPEHRFRTVADMQAALAGASQEDNSNDTVIMLPQGKSSKAVLPPSRLTEWPDQATLDQPAEHDDRSQVTRVPAAGATPVKLRQSVLQSPVDKASSRRRVLGALIGSGILATLAATMIWLWSSTPGEPLPPPVDPTATHASAVVAPEVPEAPPLMAEPVRLTPLPTVETAPSPLIAQPAPVPAETLLPSEGPVQESTASHPAEQVEPAVITTPAAVDNPDPLPIPLRTPQPAPRLQTESAAGPGGKAVVDKLPPRARQRAERRRRIQSTLGPSASPVQAQPAPAPPKRPSYWEKPTDTGFNNK